MNEHQHHIINYLIEENRVLREQIGNRRLRFSDDQRRRLDEAASLATALSLKRHRRATNQSLNRIRFCFLDEGRNHNGNSQSLPC
jgi:hypothetical protein